MKYAKKTDVSVEKTKAEIEATIRRYGAGRFMSGWDDEKAIVAFEMQERKIKFVLPVPNQKEKAFTHFKRGGYWHPRTEKAALSEWEQACRQRFRALALCIKAKFEAVECGIVSFEAEFMAHMVMPDGRTVAEHVLPQLQSGQMPRLTFGN